MTVLVSNNFGQIHQEKLDNYLSTLTIKHQQCNAKISLYGGQVLSWQPSKHQDVFWLSKSAIFEPGKAIRGGIPLCWPWFGTHPDDVENIAGNHGFARENIWQVERLTITENNVEVVLSFQGECMHDLWPNAFKLRQVLTFGKRFSQVLMISNLSDENAYFSAALHSYFAISAPESIFLDTLNDTPFDDKLTGEFCQDQLLANGVGPVDRVYHANKVISLIDNKWQRTIEVEASNTKQWVVWNPGVQIANNLADIHKNGEQEFLCLEAANTKMQRLSGGESYTISQQVSLTSNE